MSFFEVTLDNGDKFEVEADKQPTKEEVVGFINQQPRGRRLSTEGFGQPTPGGFGGVLGKFRRDPSGDTPDILMATPRSEVATPLLSGLSQKAFNIPRALMSPEQEKRFLPEPVTKFGKRFKTASDVTGILTGGAGKLGIKAAGMAPKGAGLGRAFLRGGLGGGAFGATQLADDPTLAGQAGRGATGAVFGGLLGTGIETVKGLGKLSANFINQKLAPRVNKLFAQASENFSPSVQEFAQKVAKIPKDITQYISNRTPSQIRNNRNQLGDSLDDVAENIKRGFDGKSEQIDDLYNTAFKNVNDERLLGIDQAFKKTTRVLEKNGFIDKFGNRTNISKAPSADPSLKALADFHEFLAPRVGAGTTVAERNVVGGVNKHVWRQFRDALSKASVKGGKSSVTKDIVSISDSLHAQAAQEGLTGVNVARQEASKFFQHANLLNRFDNEAKLRSIFSTGQKTRDLQAVDKYLGTNFTGQAKDVVAGRFLEKFDDLGAQRFADDSKVIESLKKATDAKDFNVVKEGFEKLLGRSDELDDIFREVKSFAGVQKTKTRAAYGLVGAGIVEGGRRVFNPIKRAIEDMGGGGSEGGIPQ